ncbi:MAG: VOC family protein [Halobacteriaceae archaeon]
MSEYSLGHVHLKVQSLDRSIPFYTEIFELEITERYDNYVFLSWGDHHHDIALQATAEKPHGDPSTAGLYHAAIEVPQKSILKRVYSRITDQNIRVTPVDHGISKALYFNDPDGNGLEVYIDTRDENSTEQWQGNSTYFDPESL